MGNNIHILTGIKQSKYNSWAEAREDAGSFDLSFIRVESDDEDVIEDKNSEQSFADNGKDTKFASL